MYENRFITSRPLQEMNQPFHCIGIVVAIQNELLTTPNGFQVDAILAFAPAAEVIMI